MPALIHRFLPLDTSSDSLPKPLPLPPRFPPPDDNTFPSLPLHPPLPFKNPPPSSSSSAAAAAAAASVRVLPSSQIRKMQPPAFPFPFGRFPRLQAEPATQNYDSSGSHHDPSSVCLAAMVDEFIESECCGACKENSCAHHHVADAECTLNIRDRDQAVAKSMDTADMRRILERLVRSSSDEAEASLLKDVQQIVSCLSAQEQQQILDSNVGSLGWKARLGAHGCAKRIVMSRLQNIGYNAAICKSRWDHSTGLSAGDYEYIDVMVMEDNGYKQPLRLIVDIDFPAQFEIARPTKEFSTIWQLLPQVFVGQPERLQQIIFVMSEATKKSLRAEGLHLPPWRKLNYLKAKWFSPYKRTTNNGSGHPCKEGEFSCNISRRHASMVSQSNNGVYPDQINELEALYHDVSRLRNADNVKTGSGQITVLASEWQLPKVAQELDPSTRKPAGAKVTGLVSLLLQGSSSGITAGAA